MLFHGCYIFTNVYKDLLFFPAWFLFPPSFCICLFIWSLFFILKAFFSCPVVLGCMLIFKRVLKKLQNMNRTCQLRPLLWRGLVDYFFKEAQHQYILQTGHIPLRRLFPLCPGRATSIPSIRRMRLSNFQSVVRWSWYELTPKG